MILKTISAHYDTVFSLPHNNRDFVPKNVDVSRTPNNVNFVMAGHPISDAFPQFLSIPALWQSYRMLSQDYWQQSALTKESLWEQVRASRQLQYAQEQSLWAMSDNPILAWMQLLTLPVRLIAFEYHCHQLKQLEEEIASERFQIWCNDQAIRHYKLELRGALLAYDRQHATELAANLDHIVHAGQQIMMGTQDTPGLRFATIEEIYERVFEPSFRAFQSRQRKCRRYEGTYLQQIREKQNTAAKGKKSRWEKNRCLSEAVEVVFTIGDMDNTGYKAAPEDAKKSERLLRALSEHLMADPHICTVTSKELENPSWTPPFRNGLILVNLVNHYDEATPGIHMTVIPYSSNCTRGPSCQPSLSKALTSMGYPTVWDVKLDDQGHPIPKCDKNGNIIYEKDGTVRYEKVPVKSGIIDWLEEQKVWLQEEMKKSYGWERMYKGSHPRGNLSTPDYKVARAEERLRELDAASEELLQDISAEQAVSAMLQKVPGEVRTHIESIFSWQRRQLKNADDESIVRQYMESCSDNAYRQIVDMCRAGIAAQLNSDEKQALQSLSNMLRDAETRKNLQCESHKAYQPNLE